MLFEITRTYKAILLNDYWLNRVKNFKIFKRPQIFDYFCYNSNFALEILGRLERK